jgi:hypothetical protein
LIAGQDCDPIPDRGFIAADEFGMMCLIPTGMYPAAQLDADAGYAIAEWGSRNRMCVADAEEMSDGNQELRAAIEASLRDLRHSLFSGDDGGWNRDEIWFSLVGYGEIDDDEEMPDDWQPTDDQLDRLVIEIGDSYYESSGLRDVRWGRYLPESVCERFGQADGGFSGEYFGFDWDDRAEIERALNDLGYTLDAAG